MAENAKRISYLTRKVNTVRDTTTLKETLQHCKRYYVDILIEELGLHSPPGNPTYNLRGFSASEVLDNHKSVLTSFGIQANNAELDLPYIFLDSEDAQESI